MFHGNPGNHQFFVGELNTKIETPSVLQKLKGRKTINVFRAWMKIKGFASYGLVWDVHPTASTKAIILDEIFWYAFNMGQKGFVRSYRYPGLEKYTTDTPWFDANRYGYKALKFNDPSYPTYISKIAKNKIKKSSSDGVMLDWWNDTYNHPLGYSRAEVNLARQNIAKSIRREFGKNKIILGNVNWSIDTATVKLINGVFLELYKPRNRLYTNSELFEIEKILDFYNKNLLSPKIIALQGWRKTKVVSNKDRNSRENRRMAKVLTAMSVVIPENGYILYSDNNTDSKKGSYDHLIYDFFDFDIGKPIRGTDRVMQGVGLKEHERGFIAYNITQQNRVVERKNGSKISIPAYSGYFCEEISERKCLPLD